MSKVGDYVFLVLLLLATLGIIVLMVALFAVLLYGSRQAIFTLGFSYLTGRTWDPEFGVYGILPAATGTLITSAIALLIAVPLSLGAAIFLTQTAPPWLRGPVGQLIELLAAIPSIIYGFWGLIILVPLMTTTINPVLSKYLGWTGLFTVLPGQPVIGLNILTASLVLSVMTIPTITAISRDSIAAVPRAQKEAALAIGGTDWEVTRRAVLPYARSGIIAGVVLGLGRALGETMAVLLVIGNRPAIATSLFSQGTTIAAQIANELGEAVGPLDTAALLESGLVLLLIAFVVNIGARMVLARFQSGMGAAAE